MGSWGRQQDKLNSHRRPVARVRGRIKLNLSRYEFDTGRLNLTTNKATHHAAAAVVVVGLMDGLVDRQRFGLCHHSVNTGGEMEI